MQPGDLIGKTFSESFEGKPATGAQEKIAAAFPVNGVLQRCRGRRDPSFRVECNGIGIGPDGALFDVRCLAGALLEDRFLAFEERFQDRRSDPFGFFRNRRLALAPRLVLAAVDDGGIEVGAENLLDHEDRVHDGCRIHS
ncbi:MAG: hypothetical protein ACMUIP_10265, partial [bacterium]